MLMVTKHVVYCAWFQENIEKRPTIKMLALTCIIELQKLVTSRMKMGADVIGRNEIICQLRVDIGWDWSPLLQQIAILILCLYFKHLWCQ